MSEKLIDTLKTLCALNGVSGDEDAVRDFLRSQAQPYACQLRTDPLGNLIVRKQGRKPDKQQKHSCEKKDGAPRQEIKSRLAAFVFGDSADGKKQT